MKSTFKILTGFITLMIVVAVTAINVDLNFKGAGLNDVLLSNIQALAQSDINDDCNYTNGYKAFTSKKGGAYDCCQTWRDLAPNTGEGNCS